MEFTVKKNDFLKDLALIQGVVEKKNTIPILSYVLITADGDHLTMVGTDMDVSLTCTSPATVTTAGTVAIQAKRLFEIVRNLPEADISIKKVDTDNVQLECARFKSKVLGQSPENFPAQPTSEQTGYETDSSTIRHLIGKTIFAITQEESRFALSGALLLNDGGKLTMVATDGHRCAIIQANEQKIDGEFRCLVPKKTLGELLKLAIDTDTKIHFFQEDNRLFFKVGQRLLISRILSGQFPNYPLIIPKDNKRLVKIKTSDLNQALRRVSLMADERSKAIKFHLSEGRLEIKSSNSEAGEASEVVPVEYGDEPMNIAFNAQYLLDFLSVSMDDEEMLMDLKDEQSQAQTRPAQQKEFDYKYIIMPMRL